MKPVGLVKKSFFLWQFSSGRVSPACSLKREACTLPAILKTALSAGSNCKMLRGLSFAHSSKLWRLISIRHQRTRGGGRQNLPSVFNFVTRCWSTDLTRRSTLWVPSQLLYIFSQHLPKQKTPPKRDYFFSAQSKATSPWYRSTTNEILRQQSLKQKHPRYPVSELATDMQSVHSKVENNKTKHTAQRFRYLIKTSFFFFSNSGSKRRLRSVSKNRQKATSDTFPNNWRVNNHWQHACNATVLFDVWPHPVASYPWRRITHMDDKTSLNSSLDFQCRISWRVKASKGLWGETVVKLQILYWTRMPVC